MKVVVIGGTGLIGTKVCERLIAQGHEALAASPRSGVNTITGAGLAEALTGAEVIIDVSNSPNWEPQALVDFFVTSTETQLAAAVTAGVKHHVSLSIVGAERASENFYMHAKLRQEEAIAAGSVPHTIVKATQFHEFIRGIADTQTSDGEVRVTDATLQTIAADEVADQVVAAALSDPAGTIEIAGPHAVPLVELVRTVLAHDGDHRTVIADHAAGYFGTVIEDDTLTPTPGSKAWIASTTLAQWLSTQH